MSKIYPEMPKPLIMKIESLRVGVKFSELALRVAKERDVVLKGSHTDFQHERDTGGENLTPPYFFRLKDGPLVQTRLFGSSPYMIDYIDDKFVFLDEEEDLTEIDFPPAPRAWHKTFEDGTQYNRISSIAGDHVGCFALNACGYWKYSQQCLYCDMNVHTQAQLRLGKFIIKKRPDLPAKAIAEIMKHPGFRHTGVTGGTILDTIEGLDDTDFYCQYLEAMRDECIRQPCYISVAAKTEEDAQKIRNIGLCICYSPHIEVWDKRLFAIMCPGKDRFIGRDEWLRRILAAVKIFGGNGETATNFVTGIEMAKPWGFKTVDDAVKSTLGGFEFLITHDVAPRTDVWAIEPGSALSGQEPPPIEYYIKLHLGHFDLLRKYGQLQPIGWCAGCHIIGIDYDHIFFSGLV